MSVVRSDLSACFADARGCHELSLSEFESHLVLLVLLDSGVMQHKLTQYDGTAISTQCCLIHLCMESD